MPEMPAGGRQVQRTDARLKEALSALLHEKPYEEIVVKEILGRANVGRSTFYAHFRDKDELLLRSIQEMLRQARPRAERGRVTGPGDGIVWFSLPVFEHIEERRRAGGVSMAPRGRTGLHEHLQRALITLIEDEIKTVLPRRRPIPGNAPLTLQARWLASTFVLVLDWWVESDPPLTAHDADKAYRELVEPSLAALFR